jgi:hypothetical protein
MYMENLKLGLTAVSIALVISACGSTQSDPLGVDTSQSSTTSPTVEDFENSLTGTWGRPCQYSATIAHYYKENIAFAGVDSGFTILSKDFYYTDSSCSALLLIKTQSMSLISINQNGNGWTYEASITAQSFAPQTTAETAALNSVSFCGITQWGVGANLDTTSTPCNTTGTISDALYLINGQLYRALDEVTEPNVFSGTIPQGTPYSKQF